MIDAPRKLNVIPFSATGERIQGSGMWCVYEFTRQLDAMQFRDRFEGRWLLRSEFLIPSGGGLAGDEATKSFASVRSGESEGIGPAGSSSAERPQHA